MRILFLGSGEFGLATLERIAQEHELVGVVTSPDKPAGRNRSSKQTAIGEWASAQQVALFKTNNVNMPAFLEQNECIEPRCGCCHCVWSKNYQKNLLETGQL